MRTRVSGNLVAAALAGSLRSLPGGFRPGENPLGIVGFCGLSRAAEVR